MKIPFQICWFKVNVTLTQACTCTHTHTHTHTYVHTCIHSFVQYLSGCLNQNVIQGGADKSLAWPTSWCRTKLIILSERGICSCAELQVFSCYRGWKEVCQATRAISTTWRWRLSLSLFVFFSARKGTEENSHHSDRNIRGTCTIVCLSHKLGGPV